MLTTCGTCGIKINIKPSDAAGSKSGLNFCSRSCSSSKLSGLSEKATGLPLWARQILGSARKRAIKKQLQFKLTSIDMASMIEESQGKCQITNITFDLSKGSGHNERRPYAPSLDRKNHKIGYTKENVRLVCVAANIAMNTWGEEILFAISVAALREALPTINKKTNGYQITFRGHSLGTFSTEARAIRAYMEAKKRR